MHVAPLAFAEGAACCWAGVCVPFGSYKCKAMHSGLVPRTGLHKSRGSKGAKGGDAKAIVKPGQT